MDVSRINCCAAVSVAACKRAFNFIGESMMK